TSLAAVINAGCLFYYLRRRKIYVPRSGWGYFALRLTFANAVLAIWLWLGAGDISAWLNQTAAWRLAHLFGLLIAAVLIYFFALWVSGIRIYDLLVPHPETVKA
ncbi:MAG TPA: hypothetical protein VHA13_00640, partial [Gammaproteobacteria bacterium]|nr:hypothetical protein [Gammaproteobacteria bacterium]